MTKDIINVGLYGGKSIFGGKETPLQASVISCDKYNECSYFKNGQCLSVRSALSPSCKFGSVNTVRGYTSRAKKYGEFKRNWKEHEQYNKLIYPPTKLGLIDDVVVFPYPFIRIEKTDNGNYKLDVPYFSSGISYIDLKDFTVDLIYKICTFRPEAFMGGEIKSYQKEKVPLFLSHLEEVMPKMYLEFTDKYQVFAEKIDYVGRKALLKTINPSFVHYKSSTSSTINNEWYWDGEFLIYQNGYVSSFSIVNDYEIEEIKLKPTDKTVIKITSNEQVTKDTVFID